MAGTLKDKCLAHYDRMISWAEKNPVPGTEWPSEHGPLGTSYSYRMERGLGERPSGKDCCLCQKYMENKSGHCKLCPVNADGKHVGCIGTPFRRIFIATCWVDFVAALRAERAFLAKLKYSRR